MNIYIISLLLWGIIGRVITSDVQKTTMHIGAFIEEMEQVAPRELAEEFDAGRIGLIIEGKPTINLVCSALDATPFVIRKAVEMHADMLVVHHTPLWNPVTSIKGKTAAVLRPLLSSGMNLYVMHTNFDHAIGGVNDALCSLLALSETRPMTLGRIGTCTLSLPQIAERLDCTLRVWGDLSSFPLLAVVAGSGFDPVLMEEAFNLGAGAFLSAEMKHSVARSAPLPCIEATHYALEAPAMRELAVRKNWHYIDDPPSIHTIP